MPTAEANDALHLHTYFAVQIFSSDLESEVVQMVFHASLKAKRLFKRLEVLDTFSVGSNVFLRCRTDQADIQTALQELLTVGRGVIARWEKSYAVKLPGGRMGTVSSLTMNAEIRTGHRRMFKGTKIVGWENQFAV